MTRRVYIETYGCQMNVADTELIAGALRAHGYSRVAAEADADVVLLNTCAVRESAEDRIWGRLGWLKTLKAQRPGVVLGVTGCMAAHVRDALIERAPYVDLIVGPDAYRRLPEMIDRALEDESDPLVDVRLDREELYAGIAPARDTGVSGFVTIMRGCDKFCTFCVVPYVRGRERSVPPDEVLRQVEAMVGQGYREVTLLGQTVNSYRAEDCTFADLLRRLHALPGLLRIRYTAPYPSDVDDALIAALQELPRVERHLHLPVQSGSTAVLTAMRRGYTAAAYRELVARLSRALPDVALTTDFIVGYPGETEEDFCATLALAREVQFDGAFMFKYSARPMTRAARIAVSEVPEAIKQERLTRLIALQDACSAARHQAMVGKVVEILVDGANPRDAATQRGRTSCFKMAVVRGDQAPGTMVTARVISATTRTLFTEALLES